MRYIVRPLIIQLGEVFDSEIDYVMRRLNLCCGQRVHPPCFHSLTNAQYAFTPLTLYCSSPNGTCVIARDSRYMTYTETQTPVNYCPKCFKEIHQLSVRVPIDTDNGR